MSAPSSRVVWFDLVTPRPDESAAWLHEVAGWTLSGDGAYRVLRAGDEPIAGVLEGAGTEPHWLPQVLTPDVDAICRRVQFLQGEVVEAPSHLEGLGTTAVIEDPGGTILAPFTPDGGAPASPAPAAQPPLFAGLRTARPDLAARTYRTLLDWASTTSARSDLGMLQVLASADGPAALLLEAPGDGPPGWHPHLRVDDLDASLARAEASGATLLHPPTSVPDLGQVAVTAGPDGTVLGWLAP